MHGTSDKLKGGPGPTVEFTTLREANLARQAEWDAGNQISIDYRLNELGGEIGEACNVIKKLERERMGIRGSRATVAQLAEELADGVICVDLLGMSIGRRSAAVGDLRDFPHANLSALGRSLLWQLGGLCSAPTYVHMNGMVTCLYAIAARENIDLDRAVAGKFNKTSEANGLKTRLVVPA